MIPELLELGGSHDGLVIVAEVVKVIINEGASPSLPDELGLPPKCDDGEERGVLLRAWMTLKGKNEVTLWGNIFFSTNAHSTGGGEEKRRRRGGEEAKDEQLS